MTTIRSMTGYGRARAEEEDRAVRVEVRSVNGRGREVRLRLPSPLLAAEGRLRERVQSAAARGRIDVQVHVDRGALAPGSQQLDLDAAARMIEAWRTLQQEFGLEDGPRAEALLRLPGVLAPAREDEAESDALERLAGQALAQALAAFNSVREEEGRRLAEDLRSRFDAVRGSVEQIRESVRDVPARLAQSLRERVEDLLGETPVDPARVAQEAALLAQRADVTEELVRLDAHLGRLAELFRDGASEIGRGLEFLVQEIRREVNTIASKASDPAVDREVLAVKAELERIREQAANLE